MSEPEAVDLEPPLDPESPTLDAHDVFGGRRGVIESTAPIVAFVAVNTAAGLTPAILAAVAVGTVLVVARLARRSRIRHAMSGFVGLLIAAALARRSGRSEDYFLPGLLLNAFYVAVFLISVAMRRPIIGFFLRQLSSKPASWHEQPAVRRAYAEVTLIWAATFALRLCVQVPLYISARGEAESDAGKTGLLGVARLLMGVPLYVTALALTLPYVARRTAHLEPADTSADVAAPPG